MTGGEAHDCPVAERLIRRVKSAKRMLGDKAYDSAELREELDERGTKPVIANRSYDRLARNYLASVCLIAALVWWILMSPDPNNSASAGCARDAAAHASGAMNAR